MRFLESIPLVTTLILPCLNALATHPIAASLETREHRVNRNASDFLHEFEQEHRGKPEKHYERLEEHKEHKSLRGLRCGQNLYISSYLHQVATKACTMVKQRKKTWGFTRFPHAYQLESDDFINYIPRHSHDESPKDGHDKKPEGPFYLYPLLPMSKVFNFGLSGSDRVIVNRHCEVAGGVTKIKSKSGCTGLTCWNPFRRKFTLYNTCRMDYRQ